MKTIEIWILFATTLIFPLRLAAQDKAVFIILDGIPADVLEEVETPFLDSIAMEGGYTQAWIGGEKNGYSQSPTISAVGYNHLLTGTWSNKHNVWGNSIKNPNYHYWNIFRIVESENPDLNTAIFSTWLDNRTKLIGEGLNEAGNIKLDYAFDGFENDEKTFPHDDERNYIYLIDEHVSKEAGRYISKHGPDLSWVYLEYTDDVGHKFGDSPEMIDAVKKADVQVGRVWKAIKVRQKKYGENWMLVVTTDHGRDAKTGKGHGGHSERERTIWIITNAKNLNTRFEQRPTMVDVMPSILRFMKIEMPDKIKEEVDGVPFVGEVSISNLRAKKHNNVIQLSWDALSSEDEVEVYISETNKYSKGATDEYRLIGETRLSNGLYSFRVSEKPSFYKVLVKTNHNWVNCWITD
jgi:predicted AlkP superfamily pyrophosphatase or phosphodiesterase